jgi:enoyl-CoA hydratase/carnithine racemase
LSAPKAQLGLPELQLGIIPGFGGEDSPPLQHRHDAKMPQLYASCKDAREKVVLQNGVVYRLFPDQGLSMFCPLLLLS